MSSGSERFRISCGLMLATALQAADATIVNIALPQLERDLGGGVELGAWVLTGYLCATAALAPLTGWLRRRYGAQLLFPVAIAGFVLASLGCSLATSPTVIILFRVLQGGAGGVIHPLSQAILLDIYPKAQHGRMLGVWGAVLMAGPILGPLIGGLITDLASWRWVFAINLPLGLIIVWLTSKLPSRREDAQHAPFDAVGVVLMVCGIGALQLSLQQGVSRSWGSPEVIAEIATALLALTALGLRSRRPGVAVLRLLPFRDLNFAVASFYNFLLSALLFVSVVFLPLMGEGPLGYSATLAGAVIVPRAVLLMLMMLGAGQLVGKLDTRMLLGAGWLLFAAGTLLLTEVAAGPPLFWIMAGSLTQSVGAGMLYTPLSAMAFSTLPEALRTDATGLYSLLRQLGYASGVALMTAVLQLRIGVHLTGHSAGAASSLTAEAANAASLAGYADCFRMIALAGLLALPGIFVLRAGVAGRVLKKAA